MEMAHLAELERELHQSATRRDVGRLTELLHESFVEYGRSGRVYDRDEMIRGLSTEISPTIWAGDFSVSQVTEGVALVTYRTAQINEQGEFNRRALRSSLWIHTDCGWQLRFHQGTPSEAIDNGAQEKLRPS